MIREEMTEHTANMHKPKMPKGMCVWCDMGTICDEHTKGRRAAQKEGPEGEETVTIGVDLMMADEHDIDGNSVCMASCTQHGVAVALGVKNKTSGDLQQGLDDVVYETMKCYPEVCASLTHRGVDGKAATARRQSI